MRYSEGFKAAIVKKTQDGSGRSVYQVAQETGINPTTLKNWISQYKHDTIGMDGCDSLTPSQRNPGEKLTLLLESRNIPEEEQAEWLRYSVQSCSQFEVKKIIGLPFCHAAIFNNACCLASDSAFI